jgi:hypothetical protein
MLATENKIKWCIGAQEVHECALSPGGADLCAHEHKEQKNLLAHRPTKGWARSARKVRMPAA